VYWKGANQPRRTVNAKDIAVQREYYGRIVPGTGSTDEWNSFIESETAP